MDNEMHQWGRNCAFFPVARGRFDSILRIEVDNTGITFLMPSSFTVGNTFWTLFFSYFGVFAVTFIWLIIAVNNRGLDIGRLINHPQRNLFLVLIIAALVVPFWFFMIRAIRKPVQIIDINRERRTITAGKGRKGKWKSVAYSYNFEDLGGIEVLRNFEYHTEGYVGRLGGNDTYELNLYFHSDDTWLGITESSRRSKMIDYSDVISEYTGVPVTESNATGETFAELGKARHNGTGASDDAEGAEQPRSSTSDYSDLPPFIAADIGKPVHEVEINENKLGRKGNPFKFSPTDLIGQKFMSHIMPLVSHLVNNYEFEKNLTALNYLCADIDSTAEERRELIKAMEEAGWRSEEELIETMGKVYDAQTGMVPRIMAKRDSYERYYMTLKDKLRVPSAKFRIIFFEAMHRVISGAPARLSEYESDPGSLASVQNSENYALRFIIGLGMNVVIFFSAVFAAASLAFNYNDLSPGAIIKVVIPIGITIGIILLKRNLKARFGKKSKDDY